MSEIIRHGSIMQDVLEDGITPPDIVDKITVQHGSKTPESESTGDGSGGSGGVVMFTVTGDGEYGCQQSLEDALRILENGGRCVLRKDVVSDWGRESYYKNASSFSIGVPNDGEPSITVQFMDFPLMGESNPLSYIREGVFFGD